MKLLLKAPISSKCTFHRNCGRNFTAPPPLPFSCPVRLASVTLSWHYPKPTPPLSFKSNSSDGGRLCYFSSVSTTCRLFPNLLLYSNPEIMLCISSRVYNTRHYGKDSLKIRLIFLISGNWS